MDGYFAHLDPLWASGPLAAVLSYFVGCMLAFILGFWFTIVYRLGGVGAVVLSLVGVAGLVVGAVGLVTWFSWWPAIWDWIVATGALGITWWVLLFAVILWVGSYLTLLRLPA